MTLPSKLRQPAWARLHSLAEVFDLREVERALGRDRAIAKVYCARWKRAGLIAALGPRNVGVFFNLAVDPNGPITHRAQAVEKLLRRPVVVVGPKALHAHGWTTQRVHKLHLAVPVTREVRSLPTLNFGIKLLPRSITWFNKLAATAAPGVEAFQVAGPKWALADALLAVSRGYGRTAGKSLDWKPLPDEIAIDPDDTDTWTAVHEALISLGAHSEEATRLLEPFLLRGLYT